MPQIDLCEPQIVRALEKAGWRIAARQERLTIGRRVFLIDIRADRLLNGQAYQSIWVEIKCLSIYSRMNEIYAAFGQYMIYQTLLREANDSTSLYLAVSDRAYTASFDRVVTRAARDYRIKLLIVAMEKEEIVSWIE